MMVWVALVMEGGGYITDTVAMFESRVASNVEQNVKAGSDVSGRRRVVG